jgi:G3E family GTPase
VSTARFSESGKRPGPPAQDIYYWSHAGHYFSMDRLGPWWAATPLHTWPTAPAERARIVADFDREPLGPARLRTFGDRRQEIVFIGIDMDQVTDRLVIACHH